MSFEQPERTEPGQAASVAPTPDEIASLLQVEHLLDQRWPETKIEPSLTRISALLDLLGSPQLAYPSIHVAGTNGKTSVARMIDAQSQADGGPAMSKFEVLTAMAFAAFADAPVDVAVIEVGMGGRWDATNV